MLSLHSDATALTPRGVLQPEEPETMELAQAEPGTGTPHRSHGGSQQPHNHGGSTEQGMVSDVTGNDVALKQKRKAKKARQKERKSRRAASNDTTQDIKTHRISASTPEPAPQVRATGACFTGLLQIDTGFLSTYIL